MPISMKYISQGTAWVNQRDFIHWIMEIWTFIALMKDSPTFLLMDELLGYIMSNCCNEMKDCGTEIDHIPGGYISKLQVIDDGVNNYSKAFIQQEYEKFIPGNVDNRKLSRLDVVHWIESGWKMGKVKKITRTWTKIGIEVFTADV